MRRQQGQQGQPGEDLDRHAHEHGVEGKINFIQSDFLNLPQHVSGQFDAIVTKGNAFPHLITDAEIEKALRIFFDVLRPGGTVIIGMHDFEPFIEDRPRFIPGRIHDGDLADNEPEIITFQKWDWGEDEPLIVTVNNFILIGREKYEIRKRPVKYRALTATDLDSAARTAIDPDAFTWVVVGDKDKVMGQLEALGMPITVVEAPAASNP